MAARGRRAAITGQIPSPTSCPLHSPQRITCSNGGGGGAWRAGQSGRVASTLRQQMSRKAARTPPLLLRRPCRLSPSLPLSRVASSLRQHTSRAEGKAGGAAATAPQFLSASLRSCPYRCPATPSSQVRAARSLTRLISRDVSDVTTARAAARAVAEAGSSRL